MTPAELLIDAFGRIRSGVHETVEGLTPDQLVARPGEGANSIAWLVWHLTRIQDDHIAHVADLDQVWTAQDWHGRFGLPFDPAETGYGHQSADVEQVRDLTSEQLVGYLDAVHQQSVGYLPTLQPDDLGRIVDDRWDPPVTLGVRLVSVLNDDAQHLGQAAFVRGLLY
jgi:uncharacterized damage-inducible protein DinB